MKLIDQTPLQNENGEIGIFQRIQGTLQYGLSWYPELQAQKTVLPQLERILKDFTIIRNHALGASGIIIPLIIIGPPGIIVAHVTHLRGTYLAKGDSWKVLKGSNFQSTAINLLSRTHRFSRALLVFLERQGLKRTLTVEPVLLAADPGMYVESQRPLVRVVMSDAIDRWANSVTQSPPVLTPVLAEELAERIIKPASPSKEKFPSPEQHTPAQAPEMQALISEDELDSSFAFQETSDYNFEESDSSSPVNDIGFAFDEEEELQTPAELPETSPDVSPTMSSNSTPRRYFGMSIKQLALLGGMVLVEFCVLIGFAVVIFLNS